MIVLDTKERFVNDLERLASLATDADLGPVLREVELDVRGGIGLNFADSASPSGQAWPARKDPRPNHPLLIKSGALLKAALGEGAGGKTRTGARDVELVIDKSVDEGGIPGAAVHNFGYPAKNIAQREFFAPKESVLPSIDETVMDALDKLIG